MRDKRKIQDMSPDVHFPPASSRGRFSLLHDVVKTQNR